MKKAISIKMEDETMYELRVLAAVSNMTLNDLLKSMTLSLRSRLDAMREKAGIKSGTVGLDGMIIRMIFALDNGHISEEDFNRELLNIDDVDIEWTPEVRLP